MTIVLSNPPPNVSDVSVVNIPPPQQPPPWYIQVLPELIIFAGFASLALTIYFSPELRSALRSVVRLLKK